MTQRLLGRRRFLAALGAGALGLPFVRALPSYAQDADKRYLILLFTPNGIVRHLWGADQDTSGGLVLRPFLAPLEKYKDKLAIVRGLENKAAGEGTHGPGMSTLWTGVSTSGDSEFGQGPSIDQAIAKELAAPTPYASLEFRARSPQDYEAKDPNARMIYADAGIPVDPREKAQDIVSSLFLSIAPGDSSAEAPVDSKIVLRKRLFSRLDSELARLSPKLCSEDKRHMDALRDGWSTLSNRLESGAGAGAGAACAYPEGVTGASEYPKATREMIDLLSMSLACDFARVTSLQFSAARSPMVADWLGHSDDHHTISHAAPQPYALGPEAAAKTDAEHPTAEQLETYKVPIGQMTDINAWYAGEIAYLCDRLSQFPAPGGKTLLDQCLICWGNELDNGSSHDHYNMPFVLIGGAGGALKTNQIVDFPVLNSYSPKGMAERAHNDLLVTLAKLMGASSITSFGDAAFNQGPITELSNAT